MMKVMRNSKFILIASCVLLVACFDESQAQQKPTHASEKKVSLEETCKELSEETGENYQIVSGKVIKYGIVPPKPSECFQGDCSWLSETSAYYVMTSAQRVEVDNEFYVYTEQEQRDELLKKKQDMQDGKNYKFCARQLHNAEKSHKGKKVYGVDRAVSFFEE